MKAPILKQATEYIRSWLDYHCRQQDIPGCVAAIAHKGKVIFNEAWGYADLSRKSQLSPQHLFRIASHSKTFTATAVMQLQERGYLRIDDSLAEYLPWLQGHSDRRWRRVTIRQLLSHSAGVLRDGADNDFWQLPRPFPDSQKLRREVLASRLVFAPNIKFKYSNIGYALLGQLIEAVTGTAYNDHVTKEIIAPLKLKNTGPEYHPVIAKRLVTGYGRREPGNIRYPFAHVNTQALSPAAGFYATASDLGTYFSAHFLGSKLLLNDESKKEMQRRQWDITAQGQDPAIGYGLGLALRHINKHRCFGHGGGFPGHSTNSLADPENNLVVVVLTNCLEAKEAELTQGIYSIIDYFHDNGKDLKPRSALTRLTGRYINSWYKLDIVATGRRIVAVSPDLFPPFSSMEELKYINRTTLKITKTSGLRAEGEELRFKFAKGHVQSLCYAGMTMWPEVVWQKRVSRGGVTV